MKLAREAGTLVSFDSNLRLKLWPLDRALACTAPCGVAQRHLPASLEDITALSGMTDPDEVVDWGHALGAKTVVLKLGGDGALVSDGYAARTCPVHRVQAGGRHRRGRLLLRQPAGAHRPRATRCSTPHAMPMRPRPLTVQGYGAVAPLPRPEQVKALLCGAALLAVDWGSSSLRGALLDADGARARRTTPSRAAS